MSDYKTIAESKNFIVLDKYAPEWKVAEGYQSEGDLEREFGKFHIPDEELVFPGIGRDNFAAFEQFIALKQGALIAGENSGVLRVEARQDAVEKSTTTIGRATEETQFVRFK